MKQYIFSALALTLAFSASAQTRVLEVEQTDGTIKTFNIADVKGVVFEDMPEYVNAPELIYAGYSDNNGLGVINLELSTSAPDEDGNLAVGDMLVSLCLTTDALNVSNLEIPAGYYRAGNGSTPLTFNIAKSAVYSMLDEGLAPSMIVNGTVDVRHEGTDYDIRMELSTLGGLIDFRYQGPIEVEIGNAGISQFEEDLNINFQGCNGRFYSNWFYPFASDIRLQFYNGEIKDNTFVSGYWFEIEMNMPKVDDPMNPEQSVIDGTYILEWNPSVKNSQYLPYTFNGGAEKDFMGTIYISGTNLVYLNPDGTRKQGLVQGGTVVVSNNGTNFDMDLLLDNGVRMQAKYSGQVVMQNFCDNDVKQPPRPYSTLKGEFEVDFLPETICYSYMDDIDQILPDIKNLFVGISVPDVDKGDYMQFTLFSKTLELPDGEYLVSDSLEEFTIIPGFVGAAHTPVYSWVGDLDSTNEYGEQEILAPIASGKMTLSTLGNGDRHFVFNFKDDKGNEIIGEYTTDKIIDFTYPDVQCPAKRISLKK